MRKTDPPIDGPVPAPGEGRRGETGYIGYLLRQAAHAYQTHLSRVLGDLEVTPPQFSVMTMIAAYPGLSNADIARLTFLTPQTVSVIIGNLVKAEIVTRRPHAVHGRIQQLVLTDSGRTLLTAAKRRVNAVEKELTDGVGADEEQRLRQWLASISSRLSDG
ncbi:DNA-binding MarR family transcriptional regulator [Rhodobium orientis]|uniref:MarR family transcriptional regulator n=1 Tax=Rhodobium orientis TaxID=34017 RepID=A0A327JT09_9HYPH|nr:MarR family transcriptional regulator [Rhodobium orientis]MBB4302502.1 DNA-binding MarR family transcriptional regulator [Rhodobium orientis]MBK5949351.1 MarR family transcriptional regulator [Rhodobium orientis]RAI28604.1 MarR family transcriptional regulator [Rhodobium orientis]